MRTLALFAACLYATALDAQVPIGEAPGTCGGVNISGPTTSGLTKPTPLDPRRFAIDSSGFCSQYSSAGWEQTMQLYLGEGASDYLELIEGAVETWNRVLIGFNQRPVIEIMGGRTPENATVSPDIWSPNQTISRSRVFDNQSVIYFQGGDDPQSSSSFAHWRWNAEDQLVEADLYINTTHEETYGPVLVRCRDPSPSRASPVWSSRRKRETAAFCCRRQLGSSTRHRSSLQ